MGEENKNQHKEVKPTSKAKTLLLLLQGIEENYNGNIKMIDLAKRLGMTKQLLNHHLQRLMNRDKVIKRIQSYPFSIYKLTEWGLRVKQTLQQSHNGQKRALWKAHNLIIGFRVKTFGMFRFIDNSRRRIIPMNNWKYAREDKGDFVINIHDTGLIKIYCPPKYSEEPDYAFGKMYADAQRIAQEYCDKYSMELYGMHTIRKGQKSLIKSEKIGKLIGRIKTEKMWIDASEGSEELEEPQDSMEIENMLGMPKQLDRMEKNMEAISKGIMSMAATMQKQYKMLQKIFMPKQKEKDHDYIG